MTSKEALTPEEVQQLAGDVSSTQINDKLLGAMKTTALTALGLGAGVRGAQGLYNLVRRNLNPPKAPGEDLVISVPTARKDYEKLGSADWDARLAKLDERRGDTHEERMSRMTGAQCDDFHRNLKRALGQDKQADGWSWITEPAPHVKNLFSGRDVASLAEHPLAGAGLVTAALGGLYGGYKLTDSVLNARKQIALDREKEEAQKQYELALQQLIQPPKTASAEPTLSEDLSRLYELVKSGTDWGGALLNVAGATWPASALLGGVVAYNLTKGRQQSQLLQKALAKRQRQRLLNEPLYAIPDYRPTKEEPPQESLQLAPQMEEALAPGLAHAA